MGVEEREEAIVTTTEEETLGFASLEEEPYLTFESVEYDDTKHQASFQFHYCGGRRFRAIMHVSIPEELMTDGADIVQVNDVFQNALFHIGLCIAPWYWMGYSCKDIRIEAGYLDPDQVLFWEEFYQDVLSEFLYLHDLDRDRLKIHMMASKETVPPILRHRNCATDKPKVLIPLGGGKDSLVVYQLLTSTEAVECAWVHVGDLPQEFERNWRFGQLVEMTSSKTIHGPFRFEHTISDPVWEREVANTRYQPCGHPWAALVAFDSVLAAILGGFTHIAVGNERSANFGNNVTHEGRMVNHQYDKSFVFESRVHNYIKTYLVEDIHYFSALQHLWEVQIARFFVQKSLESPSNNHENFLPVFLSCNEALNGDTWCYIFGENLYEKSSLFPTFYLLLDEQDVKPMECVGTAEETWLSLFLALRWHEKTTFMATETSNIRERGSKLLYLLEDYNDQHLLPTFLISALRQPIAPLEETELSKKI